MRGILYFYLDDRCTIFFNCINSVNTYSFYTILTYHIS